MTATKVDKLSWSEKQIVEYFKYSMHRLDLYDEDLIIQINECDHCSADLPSRDYDRFCSDTCEEEYERNRDYYDDWSYDEDEMLDEQYDDDAEYEP